MTGGIFEVRRPGEVRLLPPTPPPLPTPLKLGERGAIFLNDDFSKASSQALEKSIPEVQQTAALFHF